MTELVLGVLELISMVVESVLGIGRRRERKAERFRNMKPHPFDAFDEPKEQ